MDEVDKTEQKAKGKFKLKQNKVNRELISQSSMNMDASPVGIWEALIKPEIAKEYFFGAEIQTDWKKEAQSHSRANTTVISTRKKGCF
jgi:hypothetical protein